MLPSMMIIADFILHIYSRDQVVISFGLSFLPLFDGQFFDRGSKFRFSRIRLEYTKIEFPPPPLKKQRGCYFRKLFSLI